MNGYLSIVYAYKNIHFINKGVLAEDERFL